MRKAADLLARPWLTVRAQIALGAIFVAAAIPKLVDPPAFAHLIYNYRLVPAPFLNLFALVLPSLEILLGVALLLGIWKRTAAGLAGLLLFVFLAALSFNLVRGNAIDCGCFDVSVAGRTVAERLSGMRMDVLRDIGLLALPAQILWATRRGEAFGS